MLEKAYYRSFQAAFNIGARCLYWRRPIEVSGPGSTERIPEILKKENVKKAMIVTGPSVGKKLAPRIMEALDAHGLTGHIDTVFGMEDVSKVKPDPEGLLKLLDLWEMDKSEALYVGDTVIDGLAAKNAGMDFAAVTTGTTKAEAFQDIPHVAVMPDLSMLTAAVRRSRDGRS